MNYDANDFFGKEHEKEFLKTRRQQHNSELLSNIETLIERLDEQQEVIKDFNVRIIHLEYKINKIKDILINKSDTVLELMEIEKIINHKLITNPKNKPCHATQ